MGARRDEPAVAGDDAGAVKGVERIKEVKTIVWSVDTGAHRDAVSDTVSLESRTGTQAEIVAEAATALRSGGLVAFPTETVYGLGGLALDETSVRRIFAAKGRPADNPLIAHVSSLAQVDALCAPISALAWRLMEAFWPGPLSLLLPARASVPRALTAGLPMVAVRMPDHPLALALIDEVGYPLAAPSANLSGRPSPTTAAHVLQDFQGKIDGVIDGGSCAVGIESTVVAVEEDGRLVILRPGKITPADLLEYTGAVSLDAHLLSGQAAELPRAPGQKYRHYAPRGEVQLIACADRAQLHDFMAKQAVKARSSAERVAILPLLPAPLLAQTPADLFYPLGEMERPDIVARHLYAALRACDDASCTRILLECPPVGEVYQALRNRMEKAAGGSVMELH